MSLPITPSEQELMAARRIGQIGQPTRICPTPIWLQYENEMATIIATHTRHEGKTAQEWAAVFHGEELAYKLCSARAESAETTDHEINVAIAEACGLKLGRIALPNGTMPIDEMPPSYCTDLNAMHEAEKVLVQAGGRYLEYVSRLQKLTKHSDDCWHHDWHATARQRAEAFLRTLGKWEEGK